MSRKDYVLIAETIKSCTFHNVNDHSHVAEMFARALASDNSRFDRRRFLAACGVSEQVTA